MSTEKANPVTGGQTSISPPVKVKSDNDLTIRALASGIDTLYLTVNVDWSQSAFLLNLSKLKNQAITSSKPSPSQIEDWLFLVQPYGRRGYEWLIESQEYSLRIGNWSEPKKTKPSVVVEIRSETLWRLGPDKAVDRILSLLRVASSSDMTKATVRDVKVSRVDLCADILTPEPLWVIEVMENIVCRAKEIRPYLRNGKLICLDGLKIGSGDISARLYDKPQEIRVRSKKVWMFDVWGIDEVPEGLRVIRVEFQLMRQAIKELGLDTPTDLFRMAPNLWVYCTQEWLKFQDRPGCHHTQRKTLKWWSVVQGGFYGVQGAYPLIRFKALQTKQLQLIQQTYGLMTSLTALQQEQDGRDLAEAAEFDDCLAALFESFGLIGDDRDFAVRVFQKRAKNSRLLDRQATVEALRQQIGSEGCFWEGEKNAEC